MDITEVAKIIRRELKTIAKGVKFSVTCDRFSMGEAIRIVAMDDLQINQVHAVRALAKKYEGTYRFITVSV